MKKLDCKPDWGFDPTGAVWYEPFEIPEESRSYPVPQASTPGEHVKELMDRSEAAVLGTPVARATNSNNQRQFSRCSLQDATTSGVLRVGGRRFDCRLVEWSIGGFGVIVKGRPQFTEGVTGTFRAPGLNYVVSVSRMESRPEGFYVGLKQVEEVLDYDQDLPCSSTSLTGYLVAGVAGALIAVVVFAFIHR